MSFEQVNLPIWCPFADTGNPSDPPAALVACLAFARVDAVKESSRRHSQRASENSRLAPRARGLCFIPTNVLWPQISHRPSIFLKFSLLQILITTKHSKLIMPQIWGEKKAKESAKYICLLVSQFKPLKVSHFGFFCDCALV